MNEEQLRNFRTICALLNNEALKELQVALENDVKCLRTHPEITGEFVAEKIAEIGKELKTRKV